MAFFYWMNTKGFTSKGYPYELEVTDFDTPLGHTINIYYAANPRVCAGRYSTFIDDDLYDREELSSFLDFTHVPNDKPISFSSLSIDGTFENMGFASELVKAMISLLKTKDLVHLVSFTSTDSRDRFKEKFERLGYNHIYRIKKTKIPYAFIGRKGWMFYDYSGIPQ